MLVPFVDVLLPVLLEDEVGLRLAMEDAAEAGMSGATAMRLSLVTA